jgi:hypothetical protein
MAVDRDFQGPQQRGEGSFDCGGLRFAKLNPCPA